MDLADAIDATYEFGGEVVEHTFYTPYHRREYQSDQGSPV